MVNHIVVHPNFDRVWPLAVDHLRRIWETEGPVEVTRLSLNDDRPIGQIIGTGYDGSRLVSLGVPVSEACIDMLAEFEEVAVVTPDSMYSVDEEIAEKLRDGSVRVVEHRSQDFWGQSVAEFALGLTISALRRISHLHNEIISDQSPWKFEPQGDPGPGKRGHQFTDNPDLINGTISGKRIRVVGMGNIGSRYAHYTSMMGGEVAAYDPYADEPCFHRSGVEKLTRLEDAISEADVFAPMLPLSEDTRRMIDANLVNSLPEGSLVLLVTRAQVCDMEAIRERVLDEEISLAADVWDDGNEPLPIDDPVLDKENVVHTPHVAGRTEDANERWAESLVAEFTS